MKFSEFRAKKQPQQNIVITQIQETTLNDVQYDKTGNWDHHANLSDETHAKITAAFGSRDFTHFPLHTHATENHDPDVVEHLVNHGYEVSDYKKGIVSKHVTVGDPERGIPHRVKRVEEKIGSVLNKTNAPDHIKKAFVNDPTRTLKSADGIENGHHVVISTHPAAIGGMSTGTPWTSCMHIDNGVNKHYLRHESENGTHVAFLVRHDDPTAFKTGLPTHPLSRIAIKAFHAVEGDHDDTIFRAEHNHYGAHTDGFNAAVNGWAEKHYPAKEDHEYEKNSHSYDDDNIRQYHASSKVDTLATIDKGVTSYNTRQRLAAIPHDVATEATHLVAKKLRNVSDDDSFEGAKKSLETLMNVKTLGSSHVAVLRHAIKHAQPHDPGYNLSHGLAVSHGDKLSTHAIEEMYDKPDANSPPDRVLGNVKFPEHMVDNLMVSDYSKVRASKIKPHHMDKVVEHINNDMGGNFHSLASKFSADHLHKLIDGNRWGERNANGLSAGFKRVDSHIITYPAFNEEHHDKLITHYANAKYPGEHPGDSDGYDRRMKIDAVLSNSKFAKMTDIAKLKRNNLNSIASNDKIPKSEQIHVKNAIMADLGSERDVPRSGAYATSTRYSIGSHDGVGVGKIPHHIGAIMDNSDYKKLAEHAKTLTFSTTGHNEKMMAAHWDHVSKLDNEISDHVEKMRKEHGDDYEIHDADDYEDHHGSGLLDKMHKHLEAYASQIDNHLDKSIGDDDNIEDHDAHMSAGNYLEKVHKLENYTTPENSSRYDHDHYDDHFDHTQNRHSSAHEHVDWD